MFVEFIGRSGDLRMLGDRWSFDLSFFYGEFSGIKNLIIVILLILECIVEFRYIL